MTQAERAVGSCEWCSKRAQERAASRGGSVADHYTEVLAEQDAKGWRLAECPGKRGVPMGDGLVMLLTHPAHSPDHPIGSLGGGGGDAPAEEA